MLFELAVSLAAIRTFGWVANQAREAGFVDDLKILGVDGAGERSPALAYQPRCQIAAFHSPVDIDQRKRRTGIVGFDLEGRAALHRRGDHTDIVSAGERASQRQIVEPAARGAVAHGDIANDAAVEAAHGPQIGGQVEVGLALLVADALLVEQLVDQAARVHALAFHCHIVGLAVALYRHRKNIALVQRDIGEISR